MPREVIYKIVLIVAVGVLFAFMSYPPDQQIKLGLDLRGGLHLVLRVVVNEAVEAEFEDDATNVRQLLEEQGMVVAGVDFGTQAFTVRLAAGTDPSVAEDTLAEQEYDTVYGISTSPGEEPSVTLTMTASHRADVEDRAVRQALQTIRNRVDQFGVAEPVIQRQGLTGDRILVQLPGVEDAERVRNIIGRTARLEWKLVQGGPATSREQLLTSYGGELPDNLEIYPEVVDPDAEVPQVETFYLVDRAAVISGSDLKNARLSQDELGQPAVGFTLSADAARTFDRFTAENIGRQLAIVLDNRIFSAPVIESRIPDSGIIRGSFTLQDAEDLALVLRAGALPASIEPLEQRFVGPSLGRESINRGVLAAMVGMALVVAFMAVYYKGAGINAVIALLLNLIIVLGIMASLGAALTLPGIAGFILLIGMAVDANVLIFERIREELKLGKTVRSAIDAGFGKAFSAILDANLTTLIAAVFLFQFGTGAVKGFAVTITIGILASMFTALFVSRVLFQIWTLRRPGKLSI